MTKMSKKIIFFGNEKLATGIPEVRPVIREAVVEAGFEIEKVITGPLSELGGHKASLAVLAAYGRIIPQSVLDQFPLGIINVHPSLLPLYRGPTPIEQAILDGASQTGVSIMRLTAGMDEGPIYKQKTVHLTERESKTELTERLQRLGADLLLEVLPGIAEGTLKPRQQPHLNRASYCIKLTKQDGIIDWTKPAEVIEREIRAFAGWPRSRTTIAGLDIIVTSAHTTGGEGRRAEGEVFVLESKGLAVQTSLGLLVIDRLQPAGKKEMSATAFLAGYRKNLKT